MQNKQRRREEEIHTISKHFKVSLALILPPLSRCVVCCFCWARYCKWQPWRAMLPPHASAHKLSQALAARTSQTEGWQHCVGASSPKQSYCIVSIWLCVCVCVCFSCPAEPGARTQGEHIKFYYALLSNNENNNNNRNEIYQVSATNTHTHTA